MSRAKVIFDKDYEIGDVDRRLFGSFVEHMTRALYHGPYEPGHESADENGFREDVKKLIRELGVTAVRYPGGNFVSGYDWKDGIGPKEKRPVRRNLAWNVPETNEVGTDEFATYLKELNAQLLMSVNLGTGTPAQAAEEVEYCNGKAGTYWADRRIANGYTDPHGIKVWYLGNEMDGFWQIGAKTAEEYARVAHETAKLIHWADPEAELVACGSCTDEAGHATFGMWDRIVLEECYDDIDYISLHRYFNYDPDRQLAYPNRETIRDISWFFTDLQNYISTVKGAISLVKGEKKSDRDVRISFDEWGVISQTSAVPGGKEKNIDNISTFREIDAVIYGGILSTFLNNADSVKIACQSLLVNEGGMISTDPHGKAIRQSIYYPFQDVARYARGSVIRPCAVLPQEETEHHGLQPFMTAACTFDEADGSLAVFVMNCSMEEDVQFDLDLRSFGRVWAAGWRELYTEDPFAVNTFENELCVIPAAKELPDTENGRIGVTIRRHSWNVLRFICRESF